MRVHLTLRDEHDKAAGWFMLTDRKEGHAIPAVRCPSCLEASGLRAHHVDGEGNVSNSVVCRCGQWHVWVALDGWPVGRVKERGQLSIPAPIAEG